MRTVTRTTYPARVTSLPRCTEFSAPSAPRGAQVHQLDRSYLWRPAPFTSTPDLAAPSTVASGALRGGHRSARAPSLPPRRTGRKD